MGIQAFDGRRHAVLVEPGEIRVNDWLRDLGRLRQVESVGDSPIVGSILVRFTDVGDGSYATLSIPTDIPSVTVWRELEAAGVARV